MKKTLQLKTTDGMKDFTFSSSGAMFIYYKRQFGREYFNDLKSFAAYVDGKTDDEALTNLTTEQIVNLMRFAWIFAYNEDKDIPELEVWLEQFEEFPIVEILDNLTDLMVSNFTTKKH
jgi:hypothetical protein